MFVQKHSKTRIPPRICFQVRSNVFADDGVDDLVESRAAATDPL